MLIVKCLVLMRRKFLCFDTLNAYLEPKAIERITSESADRYVGILMILNSVCNKAIQKLTRTFLREEGRRGMEFVAKKGKFSLCLIQRA